MRELTIATRRLFREPWFAAAAVGTLALGIAAPTALFAVVDATLLRPLPYPGYQDIYTVRTTMTDGRFTMGGVATEEMASLRRATGDVVASALTMRRDDTLLTDATSRQVASIAVSEGFFELFGLPMSAGRSFEAGDYAAPVGTRVVISQHIWRGMFGGDPRIVGTTIRFAGISALVVGIAPAAFDVPRDADLWIAEHEAESIGHSFDGYVRLKPGLTTASVQRQLRPMWAALARSTRTST